MADDDGLARTGQSVSWHCLSTSHAYLTAAARNLPGGTTTTPLHRHGQEAGVLKQLAPTPAWGRSLWGVSVCGDSQFEPDLSSGIPGPSPQLCQLTPSMGTPGEASVTPPLSWKHPLVFVLDLSF